MMTWMIQLENNLEMQRDVMCNVWNVKCLILQFAWVDFCVIRIIWSFENVNQMQTTLDAMEYTMHKTKMWRFTWTASQSDM